VADFDGRPCLGGIETGLHLLAKQILQDKKTITIPKVAAEKSGFSVKKSPKSIINFEKVRLEVRYEDVVPDAVCHHMNGTLFTEFAVTHFCDEQKELKIKKIGVSTVEIDLSNISNEVAADLKATENYILHAAPRKWVWNKHDEMLKTQLDEMIKNFNFKKVTLRLMRFFNKVGYPYPISFGYNEWMKSIEVKEKNSLWNNLINTDVVDEFMSDLTRLEINFKVDPEKITNLFNLPIEELVRERLLANRILVEQKRVADEEQRIKEDELMKLRMEIERRREEGRKDRREAEMKELIHLSKRRDSLDWHNYLERMYNKFDIIKYADERTYTFINEIKKIDNISVHTWKKLYSEEFDYLTPYEAVRFSDEKMMKVIKFMHEKFNKPSAMLAIKRRPN
jgi:hypothetical protein